MSAYIVPLTFHMIESCIEILICTTIFTEQQCLCIKKTSSKHLYGMILCMFINPAFSVKIIGA